MIAVGQTVQLDVEIPPETQNVFYQPKITFEIENADGKFVPYNSPASGPDFTAQTADAGSTLRARVECTDANNDVHILRSGAFTVADVPARTLANAKWNVPTVTATDVTLNVSYDELLVGLNAQFAFKIVPETVSFDDVGSFTNFTGLATGTSQSETIDLAQHLGLTSVPPNTAYKVRINATVTDTADNNAVYTELLTNGDEYNTTTFTFTTPSPPVDEVGPVITLIGDATVYVAKDATYNDAGANAADVVDGNISGNIVTTISSVVDGVIVTTSSVDTSTIKTYTVQYNVSDAAGNAATQVTRTVHVEQQMPKSVTLEAPIAIHQDDSSITFRLTAKKQGRSSNNLEFKIVESGDDGRQSDYVVGTQVGDPDDKMYEAKVTLEKGDSAWNAVRTFTPHVKDGNSVKTAPGKAQSVIVNDNVVDVTNSFKQQLAAVEKTANARGNRIAEHFRTANDSALNDLENETLFTVPGSFKQASDGVTDEERSSKMVKHFARNIAQLYTNEEDEPTRVKASREDIQAMPKIVRQRNIPGGTYLRKNVSEDSAHMVTKRPLKISSENTAESLSSLLVESLDRGQKRLTIQTTMTD